MKNNKFMHIFGPSIITAFFGAGVLFAGSYQFWDSEYVVTGCANDTITYRPLKGKATNNVMHLINRYDKEFLSYINVGDTISGSTYFMEKDVPLKSWNLNVISKVNGKKIKELWAGRAKQR